MLQADGGDRSRRRRIHPAIAPIAATDSQTGFLHWPTVAIAAAILMAERL